FWLFGHPEVYIIFLPAVGILSMVVPTFARRPVVGYYWFVLAAITTGFLSFGLWVHHMYTVGIPQLSLAFFSAASLAVAIPNGIQVFALIGTLWRGRPVLRTPLLFVVGFVIIFVLGGFTGVMLAVVPFDTVVHDTQFVVAHFHYVLIGGVVFPLFAGLYYWLPLALGRMPSERLGRWSFWVMFAGFNVGFMPLHHTGLIGMPRRVFTYPAGLGWEWTNLAASVGAYVFAVGVLLTLVNVVWTWRRGAPTGDNPWNAGTLEWLRTPPPVYNFRSVPQVEGRDPVWSQPRLAEETERGRFYLADTLGGRRLTMGSSVVDARADQMIELPGPTYVPVLTALAVGLFFVGFLVKLYALSVVGAALTLLAVVVWMWEAPDRTHPRRPLPAGPGLDLPLNHGLHHAPAWTALVVTLAIDATLYASLVYAYLYLWSFAPAWPPDGLVPPDLDWAPIAALAALVASSGALAWAESGIRRGDRRRLALGLAAGAALGGAYLVLQMLDMLGFGFAPRDHAYASLSYTLFGYQALHLGVALVMVGMALARAWRGDFAPDRHVAVRIAARFWHFSVVLWLIGFVLVYLSPFLF
ncbi:MAG TPA: cbb3-type cytochrome c oxidase subunit I, partial [Geminicoccaceae bacterium]|nr:cbb3-type cytochrome c oxidase subunit I [Geminicoccaceae bacterium]